MDDLELKHRVNEVAKIFKADGWAFIESEWILEREKIINTGKKAVEDGATEKAAYLMAELAGFDRALRVPHVFKQRFEELCEPKEKQEEFQNA